MSDTLTASSIVLYSQDHKFSKVVSECFRDIGEWQFVNPIASYPWGGRNRVIARIRIFEKYLTPADVFKARWIQNQAVAKAPSDWMAKEAGIEYLNTLLAERSNGKFWDEMNEIATSLPTVMEYAEQEYGSIAEAATRARLNAVPDRRRSMHIVTASMG